MLMRLVCDLHLKHSRHICSCSKNYKGNMSYSGCVGRAHVTRSKIARVVQMPLHASDAMELQAIIKVNTYPIPVICICMHT